MTVYGSGSRTWAVRYFAANGDLLDFSDASRFYATTRHGFGTMDVTELVTHGIRQNGDTLLGVYAKPREVEIGVEIMANRAEPMATLRRRIASAFSPLAGDGILEYRDVTMGRIYTLTVRPVPPHLDTSVGMALHQTETLHWRAHDPMLYGPANPINIYPDGSRVRVTLVGDVPVGWTLLVPGPLTNPTFENLTTGAGMTIAATITPSESLQITSIFNQKSALAVLNSYPFTQRNIYTNRAIGSTYWQLALGDNLIRLSTSPAVLSGGGRIGTFTYSPAYVGV